MNYFLVLNLPPFALQIVGRPTEISELDEWGERTPRTQIVAIGESGGYCCSGVVH